MQSNTFEAVGSAAGLRFAIAVSRFNPAITERLLEGAIASLQEAGCAEEDVSVTRVPGAWELPLAAQRLAGLPVDAVICLGAVIRGDTPHFDYVAGECARGLMDVQLASGVPIVFGVLTTDTLEQAEARVGGAHGHKGADAALTAIEMAHLMRDMRS